MRFHVNCRISLLSFVENLIFIRILLNVYNNFKRIDISKIFSLSIHENNISYSFFVSSITIYNILYGYIVHLPRFIPSYLINFPATLNKTFFSCYIFFWDIINIMKHTILLFIQLLCLTSH